jgi:hypothetical protein
VAAAVAAVAAPRVGLAAERQKPQTAPAVPQVASAPVSADAGPSFTNIVEPVLTRAGYNQGACHGKNAGQGGFRLSLRGYAPELDHNWITRELGGRRVSLTAPAESLLLRKGLGQVPHKGGAVLVEGSREHKTLLSWITAGAPGPVKGEAEIRGLSLLPGPMTLKVGDERTLTAKAEFSDGRVEDVTWLTKFESNDAGLVEADPSGRIKALRHGETAVRASFLGLVAVVIVTIPFDREIDRTAAAKIGTANFVDTHVFAKLAGLGIEPSGLCTDAEFLRRASLDATGTLPTAERVRAFLSDKRPDKRARLIDELLSSPAFDDYWTLQLADLLQNRRERDHDVRGVKGVQAFHSWLRRQVAANRPWDAIARDVLTATGDTVSNPAVGWYVVNVGESREGHKSEVVASAAMAFLGTRIGCAQCHNHPLEKYTQDDYYHFAGFFSRVRMKRENPQKAATVLTVSAPDEKQNKNPVGVTQPRTGQFLAPRPLDRSATPVAPTDDPRAKLAAWVTDPANEYFAGAMVNRVWKHYMGVGLVEPVDDLRATNPPSNPELWKALLAEFTAPAHRFDLRHLMRTILNSRAYQLSSATHNGNEADTRYHSHYYVRRLPAEVLCDALSDATGVPESFPGYPTGLRAVQLPDPSVRSYFLGIFGRSERTTACVCERSNDVTMAQLLHLGNGEPVTRKIKPGEGRLGELLAVGKDGKPRLSDREVIEAMFLSAYGRPPEPLELAAVQRSLSEGDNREESFRDLFWALLNSKEFAFNH